ncbi:Class II abasic (AP) endonuclease [Mortierella sp. AD094]|nr:Class II abasic (AP) endonuclease [Mortierella sp. AD094]
MKFMTWNVNGIRTLTQYHPYCDDLHKNYREILDYLDADVICLQETKINRSKLESDLALVPGYDSYWSFHRTKSGYSGVVIYVKDHIKLLAAEEGISGVISGNITSPTPLQSNGKLNSAIDPAKKKVGGYPSLDGDEAATFARYQELDSEGRGIVLDFGFFVLFNLYCPNETDETRLPFKMDYYHLLEARVQELIKEGRQVIVVGDMNVIPTELDHCDPAKWKKDSGEDDFTNTLPRRWFNNFLAPAGPLTDLYRVFHKGEPGAFTCWNTKINARPSNYGTRLDFILVTSGLLPWFKSCDRKPHVVGSDHCPVVAEMQTELSLEKSEEERIQDREAASAQRLQDILDSYGGTNDHTLSARYFDEFSGKQQKLSSFFKKPITQAQPAVATPTTHSVSETSSGSESKRHALQETPSEEAPRKKPFFSKENSDSSSPPSTPSTSQFIPTSKNAAPVTASNLKTSSPQATQKSNIKTPTKAGSNKSSSTDKNGSKKSAGSKQCGQQSVLSFFSSPSKKASDDTTTSKPATGDTSAPSNGQSMAEQDIAGSSQSSIASSSLSQTLDSSSPSLLSPFSDSTGTSSTPTSTFSPNDFADWIPGSQDVMPFSTNAESTTSKWQNLFQPRAVPKCRFHGVPCTEYTVNKKGFNKGRRFYLCSL